MSVDEQFAEPRPCPPCATAARTARPTTRVRMLHVASMPRWYAKARSGYGFGTSASPTSGARHDRDRSAARPRSARRVARRTRGPDVRADLPAHPRRDAARAGRDDRQGQGRGIGAGLFGGAGLFALYGLACLVAAAILGACRPGRGLAGRPDRRHRAVRRGRCRCAVGKREVSAATPPVPNEAVEGVKQDVQTLKSGSNA